jgi:hypothetical protein
MRSHELPLLPALRFRVTGCGRVDGQAGRVAETPVVNCVLLWATPGMEGALSAYEDKVLRLVAEHGGRTQGWP